ncbi:MAG: efflux RND transporter periplasmic adaptor subunit [Pseudomonadales bacterium]|nr:efflux RND transporter periplasmic adaptor subunit [Pseudomonadales bacterium]
MRKLLNALLLALFSGLLVVACSNQEQASSPRPPAAPAAAVTVMTLTPQNIALKPEYIARTAGSRQVEVRARVEGILLTRHYDEGTPVAAGDLLFQIDPRPYEVELARAEAQLERAQAQFRSTQRDWNRAEAVFKKGVISESDKDAALSALELATAEVSVARAEVNAARINLDYTRVTAPISGITSREAVSEGSLVGPDGSAQSLLTTIVSIDPLYVTFSYPDTDFIEQRRLQAISPTAATLQAELLLPDGSLYRHDGVINFTDSVIDTNTSTVQARAVFPNPEQNLLPGQFLRIHLLGLELNNALLVPQEAVLQGSQGTFVYRIDGERRAQAVPVQTGRAIAGQWIITRGLAPGDRIISNGIVKVQPGQVVSISSDNGLSAAGSQP